jgi:hypothetical protein
MVNLWYKNPQILFTEYKEFIPNNSMDKNQKLNAIARFAIYLLLIVTIFGLDGRLMALSFALLALTFFLGQSEKFSTESKCTRPTPNNPFMNFTVGDLMEDPQRPEACPINNVRDEQIEMYKSNNIFPNMNDLWGKMITDRNFYTMPSTGIVNDQEGFAKFLLNDAGKCKSEGTDCLKHHDNRFHRGRYYYQY